MSPAPKALRRDAVANQTRIVDAAHQVFADQGVDAPMADVAKAAGVGVATLSRRFSRHQLVQAVIDDRLSDHLVRLEAAVLLPPLEGFVAYMEGLCERRVIDRSLCHALTLQVADSPRIEAMRKAVHKGQLQLLAQGQEAGVLRPGIVPQDLVLTLEAVGGVMEATEGTAAWRRTLAMLMESLTATREPAPLPAPPTSQQLQESRSGPARGRRTSPIPA